VTTIATWNFATTLTNNKTMRGIRHLLIYQRVIARNMSRDLARDIAKKAVAELHPLEVSNVIRTLKSMQISLKHRLVFLNTISYRHSKPMTPIIEYISKISLPGSNNHEIHNINLRDVDEIYSKNNSENGLEDEIVNSNINTNNELSENQYESRVDKSVKRLVSIIENYKKSLSIMKGLCNDEMEKGKKARKLNKKIKMENDMITENMLRNLPGAVLIDIVPIFEKMNESRKHYKASSTASIPEALDIDKILEQIVSLTSYNFDKISPILIAMDFDPHKISDYSKLSASRRTTLENQLKQSLQFYKKKVEEFVESNRETLVNNIDLKKNSAKGGQFGGSLKGRLIAKAVVSENWNENQDKTTLASELKALLADTEKWGGDDLSDVFNFDLFDESLSRMNTNNNSSCSNSNNDGSTNGDNSTLSMSPIKIIDSQPISNGLLSNQIVNPIWQQLSFPVNKLLIRNLPSTVTEESLIKSLNTLGEVKRAIVYHPPFLPTQTNLPQIKSFNKKKISLKEIRTVSRLMICIYIYCMYQYVSKSIFLMMYYMCDDIIATSI
jgi:hypothetical protein